MFSRCEEHFALRSARKTNLQRARALTTIYGTGLTKTKRKKTRTAVEDSRTNMLKNDTIPKSGLSPFSPLPAIGKVASDDSRLRADNTQDTKVIVFDITKRQANDFEAEKTSANINEVLKPLTPLRVNGYHQRRVTVECFDALDSKPQQLLRENTYDVIKPLFLASLNVQKRDSSLPRRNRTPIVRSSDSSESNRTPVDSVKNSPRSRFRKAAMDAKKLCTVPETGRLLCLRQKMSSQMEEDEEKECRPSLPVNPAQRLNKLSEIFQNLDVKGRHRDKMKKENNWF